MPASDPLDVWMKESGAISKCKNKGEVSAILSILKTYSKDQLPIICSWEKKSRAFDRCQNIDEIVQILSKLQIYSKDRLPIVFSLMRFRCEETFALRTLVSLNKYPPTRLGIFIDWMKNLRVFDKFKNVDDVSYCISALNTYPEDQLLIIFSLMKRLIALDKFGANLAFHTLNAFPVCFSNWLGVLEQAIEKGEHNGAIRPILNVLGDYLHKDQLIAWMKSSGALDKCQNGDQIARIFKTLRDYPDAQRGVVTTWMKSSGIWDKCQEGEEIAAYLATFIDFDFNLLKQTTKALPLDQKMHSCILSILSLTLKINASRMLLKR